MTNRNVEREKRGHLGFTLYILIFTSASNDSHPRISEVKFADVCNDAALKMFMLINGY